MLESRELLKNILDRIDEDIVVLDLHGNVAHANQNWVNFSIENDFMVNDTWEGVNFLQFCDNAKYIFDRYGPKIADGIRSVIKGTKDHFKLEYPCHRTDKKRWFMIKVGAIPDKESDLVIINHQNITEKKLAQEEIMNLTRTDGLTGIPNRKHFDAFIHDEWRRCARLKTPVSIALIDMDFFKVVNDIYGSLIGDSCLIQTADLLKKYTRRPGDICARYKGEEFALIWGNTPYDNALQMTKELLERVREIQIPERREGHVSPTVTASIGMITAYPEFNTSEADYIKEAEALLMAAKQNGRDQVVSRSL